MKITYCRGNLLDVAEGIIVHGVNKQGVMGAGVAKAIKQKYPQCFYKYTEHIPNTSLGDVIWCNATKDLIIANAVTQNRYGTDKRHVNYMAVGLAFSEVFRVAHKQPIHIPKIGAGLAGGDWNCIEQIIYDTFAMQVPDTVKHIKEITCWEL